MKIPDSYKVSVMKKRIGELEEDNESLQILESVNRKRAMELHQENKIYKHALEFSINHLQASEIRQVKMVVHAMKEALKEDE